MFSYEVKGRELKVMRLMGAKPSMKQKNMTNSALNMIRRVIVTT